MTDIHEQAAGKLPDLAKMIENELPEGTHFALVIATPLDDLHAETAHVTTMETADMVQLVLAHVRAVMGNHRTDRKVPRSEH